MPNDINPAYALRGIVINLIYSFSAGVSWQGHIGGGIAEVTRERTLFVWLVLANRPTGNSWQAKLCAWMCYNGSALPYVSM